MKKVFVLFFLLIISAVSFASVNVGILKYELNEANHTANLLGPVDTSTISGAVVIPDSVVYDGESYMVTRIWYQAFSGCRNITSVYIPNSVNVINFDAFFGCSSLTTVNIPEGVTILESNTFSNCTSLVSVSLPSTLTTIGMMAFSGCSSLVSITLPEGLVYIKSYAFQDCSSLASIVMPNSLTDMGSFVFDQCSSLSSVVISNSLDTIGSFFSNCTSLSSVVIPESVSAILSYAFHNTAISEVIIPASVSFIDQYAFMNSPLLKVRSLNTVPAVCHKYAFSDSSARLFVPTGYENDYAAAEGWKRLNIVLPGYNLTTLPNDSTEGMTLGDGIFESEENAVVMAVPMKGFYFDGWSDGATDNPRNFSVTFDAWALDSTISPTIEDGYSVYIDTTITALFVPHVVDTVFVHDTVFEHISDTVYITLTDTVTEFVYDTVYVEATDTIYLEYDGGSAMEYSLADLNVYYFMGRVANPDNVYIKLYAANGKLLAKGTEDIDMSNLPSAVYIVTDGKGGFLKIVHENSY